MYEDFYLGNKSNWEDEHIDEAIAAEISGKLGIPVLAAKVLAARGITDEKRIRAFLKPSVKELHPPMLLPDMKAAIQRILDAKGKKEKILIYGDYDVDGITATSMLVNFFNSQGMAVSFYIPDRTEEGYGISEAAVSYISEHRFDLMITVDCGISAKDRIYQIQRNLLDQNRSMDVIITDHHQPQEETIPDAYAVVCPHLIHNEYPFPMLCGAGIAFKMVQALSMALGLGDAYLDYIDLAALGTVADIVSLTGENRVLVWAGLKKIQRCPNPGIQALLNACGQKAAEVDSIKLAYLLAPRVNAAGRMGDATRGVHLFSAKSLQEAEEYANLLHEDNYNRQKIQEEILAKALENLEADPSLSAQRVIVVCGEGWHHGVIGIVASNLADRFFKPTFVLSIVNGIATGSARSIEGFNVFSAMQRCGELFVKYGGHEQAAGFTIVSDKIDTFRHTMNQIAAECFLHQEMTPRIKIDVTAKLGDINKQAAEAILAMAPFGEGNPAPVFRINDVEVLMKKKMGAKGDHLKLRLGNKSQAFDAVAFKLGEMEPFIPLQGKMDIIFSMSINEYMGNRSLQLIIKAMRLPEMGIHKNRILLEAAEKVECLDYNEEWLYNGINNHLVNHEDICLSREELGTLYRYLQKAGSKTLNRAQLFRLAEEVSQGTIRFNYFKLLSGMFVFDELDIIRFSFTEKGDYRLQIPDNVQRASLEDSMLYTFLQSIQQVVEK